MFYLFKLSDATMDCSACYIQAFCCEKSHLFTSFQLGQAYFLSISLSILWSIISALTRAALYPNVSDLNFSKLHNATPSVEDTIAWTISNRQAMQCLWERMQPDL